MIQEVVHHRLRMTGDSGLAVADARDVAELVTVVPFDEPVLARALELIEHTGIRGRDAVHAATALAHGVDCVVSTDPAFDLPELSRVDPVALSNAA
jgi:predicted nucleic acid-binding protein